METEYFGNTLFKEKRLNSQYTVSDIILCKLNCHFKLMHTVLVLQGTCKIGCTGHIVGHFIILYTDFQIPKTSGFIPRKLKKELLQKLHSAINENKLHNAIKMFHVLLPDEEAHHSLHPTQGAVSYAQRLHPKVIEKIYELVNDVCGPREEKEILQLEQRMCLDLVKVIT